MQVGPIQPKLKPTGIKRLKLVCATLLSEHAFRFNLRRHNEGGAGAGGDGGGGDGGGGGGGGGGGRLFTSMFRGVSAVHSSRPGRWNAMFNHIGVLGTFDREVEAARAWNRMMLWCNLHGVVLTRPGGQGRAHTSASLKAALNFAYEEYEGEVDELQGIMTQDAMVQKLRQEGQLQPGSCKSKRAEGGVLKLLVGGWGGGGGSGGGDCGRGGGGGGGGGDSVQGSHRQPRSTARAPGYRHRRLPVLHRLPRDDG